MTALPPATEVAHLLIDGPTSTPFSAYRTIVLPAEKAALSKGNKANLIHVRIVGYLLLHPPSQAARRTLSLEIVACGRTNLNERHEAVFDLGAMYLRHFICIFRKSRGKTPTPSSHPSRPSFDRAMEECRQDLQRTPRNHTNAKASALVRDNYRCMVTGVPDLDAMSLNLTSPTPDGNFAVTQCSHIFPEALGNVEIDGSTAKEHEAATVWTILNRFGYEDISAELGSAAQGANLHRLENILTLDAKIHHLFNTLRMWFEAVEGQPNCYNIELAPNMARPFFIPRRVQFVSHHPELPLPSPRYLEVHAACCRIAHMSGAADYLDLIYRHMEELKVLANNGASADVLSFALHRRLAVAEPV